MFADVILLLAVDASSLGIDINVLGTSFNSVKYKKTLSFYVVKYIYSHHCIGGPP